MWPRTVTPTTFLKNLLVVITILEQQHKIHFIFNDIILLKSFATVDKLEMDL